MKERIVLLAIISSLLILLYQNLYLTNIISNFRNIKLNYIKKIFDLLQKRKDACI